MLFSKLYQNKNVISLFLRELHTTSLKSRTHYDTLNLPRDCSSADIRNAYLKLSKQYHPDKKKDDNSHKEFLKISAAYKVLSKSSSRRDYDLGLSNPSYQNNSSTQVKRTPYGVWTDDSFWEQRDKSKDSYYKSQPYYGIQGVKKISNIWIVFLCIGFTTIGILFQILAIRRSFTLRRSDMEKRSAELEKLHADIRAKAIENGDKKQLELLIERLNNSKH